jgi:hypothetical protein
MAKCQFSNGIYSYDVESLNQWEQVLSFTHYYHKVSEYLFCESYKQLKQEERFHQ